MQECLDSSLNRVTSSELRRDIDNVPSTSVIENVPQDLNEIENLKSSLRKEITEELKALVAESQNAIIQALRPVNRGDIESSDLDPETTPVRTRPSLSKTLRFNDVEILEPNCSRNMVTGVPNDPTHTNKKTKNRSQSQSPAKERPNTTKASLGTSNQTDANNTFPMPEALTTSLPTCDGKCEKFELFEDLFRKNLKMYPHLSEIQKRNYFHSLLRGEALQDFRNLDDTKKDNLEDIITIFKRRFGDYLSMAKARCEWDTLKFDPSTQKLHEFLDLLQKTAKEAFGVETQQFIDKAIYAKMPDHVKKILNRAYLEDKPYNDIVLHLEREMKLNGLGAPDDVTLVPLNHIETTTTPTTKSEPKPGFSFYCNKYGHYKAQCRKLKRDNWQETKRQNGQFNPNRPPKPKCDTCGKPHKTEDCWNGANAANDPRPKRHTAAPQKLTKPLTSLQLKKQKLPRLRFGDNVDARA